MAELYTIVQLPAFTIPGHGGYALSGRRTRQQAIDAARAHYERQRHEAEIFLGILNERFDVRVVRGVHRETLVEILEP